MSVASPTWNPFDSRSTTTLSLPRNNEIDYNELIRNLGLEDKKVRVAKRKNESAGSLVS